MALPNTPETVNILNRERIARLPKEAIVINVGRGNALDQAALAEALNTDHIARRRAGRCRPGAAAGK